MAHTEPRAENRASNRLLLEVVLKRLATTVTAFRAWRRAGARRRAIADMTPEQLKDIGVEAPRPTLDDMKVAALITKLMSMR